MDGTLHDSYEIEVGNVKISPDVISAIAYVATTEIEGIAGMAQNITGGIAELLGKRTAAKGIRVEIEDSVAQISAYIIVKYGAVIPELAVKLQERIKSNVETMTGISVQSVNVHVQGVKFEEEQPKDETSFIKAKEEDWTKDLEPDQADEE